MKKIFLALVLLLMPCAFANPQGVHATVELLSGTRQTAQFIGLENDTVSLGGSIKGQFTIVRIPANSFKSIVDDSGNDLLHPKAPEAPAPKTDSLAKNPEKDTVAQEMTAEDSAYALAPREILDSVEGKHIYVVLERRGSDSTLAEQLDNLIIRLLKERGTPLKVTRKSDFGFCRDASCIRDSLMAHEAASAYIGRITAARTPDSVSVQATHYTLDDSTKKVTSATAQISLSAIQSLGDALGNDKLKGFVATLQGESIAPQAPAKKTDGKSYIHVETDPEGANIALHGKEDICKSPCTFVSADTGKNTLYAYWTVNNQLWSTKAVLRPIPGDTTKISLKLKKVKPELRITTTPEGADIFAGSAPLTPKSTPIGKTPNKFPIFEPGLSTVQIRKIGFRDTMVTVFASPTENTDINVELTPITNLQEQIIQDEWQHQRKRNLIGKTLMGTSVAPILLGALFSYLATLDYDDADHVKNELDRPATGGENYQAKVKENKDLVKKGDKKMIIGGSLLGAGVLLFGVGFILTF